MASDRFVKLPEADLKPFFEKQESVNTNKKTLYELKLFKQFLTSEDERRELQEILVSEIQQFAKKFVLRVRRQKDLCLNLHLLKVYIFTAHFEIRKLIFVGYVMYSWIVTLAARFTFWHKIYFNFELYFSLFFLIKRKLLGVLKIRILISRGE